MDGAKHGGGPLQHLRAATRSAHAEVDHVLDLLAADVDAARVTDVVIRLGAFWRAAEAGLDAWADAEPAEAERVAWADRRRAHRYPTGDAGTAPTEAPPAVPPLTGTGEALGRLYVLEGSTLGGRVIVRHLGAVPGLALDDATLRCFDPYRDDSGRMWQALRHRIDAWDAAGGDRSALARGAVGTFEALRDWIEPLRAAA